MIISHDGPDYFLLIHDQDKTFFSLADEQAQTSSTTSTTNANNATERDPSNRISPSLNEELPDSKQCSPNVINDSGEGDKGEIFLLHCGSWEQ